VNRLERLCEKVDEILARIAPPKDWRSGFAHLHGVSAAAALLALRRGQDAELAAIAGMLHDLSTYETGVSDGHAESSARRAVDILRSMGAFRAAEIEAVRAAIDHHSDKAAVHDPFSEVLKDADVLQHFLSNPEAPPLAAHAARREALRLELGL
jgi:HD superfamily phosphodiesterase